MEVDSQALGTMQMVLGSIITIVVVVLSGFIADSAVAEETEWKFVQGLVVFILAILACYVIIAVVSLFFWVIAMIGILFYNIHIWIIEALFWFF